MPTALARGEFFFGSRVPKRETDLLPYIEKKVTAIGLGESFFGSRVPEHGMGLVLYIEKKNSALGGRSTLGASAEDPPLEGARKIHFWSRGRESTG